MSEKGRCGLGPGPIASLVIAAVVAGGVAHFLTCSSG
jgi:hypothetical protein